MTKGSWWWAAAVLWFAAWHLFLFSPVWADPTHLVPGPIGDNTVMLWNLAWVHYALDRGSPGFWMPKAFYPEGFLFLYGTHTWLDGLLGWLASPVLPSGSRGIILWANLVQLAASVATGILTMAALRHWGVKRWQLQLLAASAITWSAFRIYASTGHYHFFGTQWMLAALWMAAKGRRLLRVGWARPGIGWCVGAGLMIGVAFLNDQTHAVFAVILLCLGLGSLLFRRGRAESRSTLLAIAGAGLAAVAVSLIHLVPINQAIASGKFQYRVPLAHERVVDFTSIFLPDNGHSLLGRWLTPLRQAAGWTVSEGPYLGLGGYIFLFAGLVGSLRAVQLLSRGRRNPWRPVLWATLSACGFLVLAMGEYLQIGHHRYGTLPGRLLREIPVLNNIRLMHRWVWPAHLCLAVAGGLALSLWMSGHMSRRWSFALVALAVLVSWEGRRFPSHPPTDITRSSYLNPPGLVPSLLEQYTGGGVLCMPVEHTFGHSNAIQFNSDFAVNITVAYTARSPWDPTQPPWQGPNWSPEAERWMREKQVTVVVFPIEFEQSERNLEAWMPWVRGARAANPELVVIDRNGQVVE